jgi:addiction module HigA family antidote
MSNTTSGFGRMHNPPHPGAIVRHQCLAPLGLTVTDAAKALGVTRTALSQFLNGRSRLSLEMAKRLSLAFRTSVESWLNLQVQYDVWSARAVTLKPSVKPLVPKRHLSA